MMEVFYPSGLSAVRRVDKTCSFDDSKQVVSFRKAKSGLFLLFNGISTFVGYIVVDEMVGEIDA